MESLDPLFHLREALLRCQEADGIGARADIPWGRAICAKHSHFTKTPLGDMLSYSGVINVQLSLQKTHLLTSACVF